MLFSVWGSLIKNISEIFYQIIKSFSKLLKSVSKKEFKIPCQHTHFFLFVFEETRFIILPETIIGVIIDFSNTSPGLHRAALLVVSEISTIITKSGTRKLLRRTATFNYVWCKKGVTFISGIMRKDFNNYKITTWFLIG